MGEGLVKEYEGKHREQILIAVPGLLAIFKFGLRDWGVELGLKRELAVLLLAA